MAGMNGAGMSGRFVWYELMTTDVPAAEAFYGSVLGWSGSTFAGNDVGYRIMSVGTKGVGGMMRLCGEAAARGARPGWYGYVAVADVDASAGNVAERGGAVLLPPQDIPAVGRYSVVADPQGAVFMLFAPSDAAALCAAPAGAGTVAWHELLTSDRESAIGFYADMFGWAKHRSMDMGPAGVYQIFGEPDGDALGGMFDDPASPPHWLFYVAVEGVDSASARISAGGGAVLRGPQEVPGGVSIITARDPQGAMFAIVGPRG